MPRPKSEILQGMLQELLDLEDGLGDWEINFIDSIDKQTKGAVRLFSYLSDKQVETLERIYRERVG